MKTSLIRWAQWCSITMLALLAMTLSLHSGITRAVAQSDFASDQPPIQPPSRPVDPLPAPPPNMLASAPGYCASGGGSTSYESISSVNISNTGPHSMTLSVNVYIANPTGCTVGYPCPEYDSSPENVNVWVDFDGDKLWEASEKVIDQAMTGYTSISYHGTMTASSLVQIPANAVASTWIRANLGWGSDPNDPCLSSWAWGNVVDRSVVISTPQIASINARGDGTPGNNPTTGKKVILESVLNNTNGFTINKCTWSGDVPQGEVTASNCHYEFTPATGAGPSTNTYGEKNVTLTVTYTHTASGITGQISKNSFYKVFFEKTGDDDGDSTPNWFEYWGDDSAVPQLAQTDVVYNAALGASTYGRYVFSTDQVEIGGAAPNTHYPSGISVPPVTGCPGGNFGGAKGVDSATEVVEHELRHKWVHHNWDTGGLWNGLTDSDKGVPSTGYDDNLPDTFETNTTHTANDNTDSCDLETHKDSQYARYGDNEFHVMTYSNGQTGTQANDWANPGKQTTPSYGPSEDTLTNMEPVAYSGATTLAPSFDEPLPDLVGFATLSGEYTSAGQDIDGDGLFNTLNLSVGVDVTVAGSYTLVGWLQNGSGTDIVFANVIQPLSSGNQTLILRFSGPIIRASGFNGPYTVARIELLRGDEAELVDADSNPHTTTTFSSAQFDPVDADFTGAYTITPLLVGGDSYYDVLRFAVGMTVNLPGTYTIIGELAGPAPKQVAVITQAFSPGVATVNLDFDGAKIFQSRTNGPYTLTNLRLLNGNGEVLDFVLSATSTSAYAYTSFKHGSIFFVGASFVDSGLNMDADVEFEYLKEAFQITSTSAGSFLLKANLTDSQGKLIYSAQKEITLSSGINNIFLEIPGGSVYSHGVNGPYRLEDLMLLTPQGVIVDFFPLADETNAYNFTSFSHPLLNYTGVIEQQTIDSDNNGLYETINFTVRVQAGETGYVTLQGTFVDQNGNLILVRQMNAMMTKGQTIDFVIPLTGYSIIKVQANGPYTLREIYLFHAADTAQYVFDDALYTTPTYTFQQFEGFFTSLPIIRR